MSVTEVSGPVRDEIVRDRSWRDVIGLARVRDWAAILLPASSPRILPYAPTVPRSPYPAMAGWRP